MADIIRVAIIGCGQMGMHHAKIYASLPGVELVAICENYAPNREKAVAELNCKGFADMEEMFQACPEIDAVSITMPDNAHLGAVQVAAKYNKHILLEKPIADGLEDGQEILKLTKDYEKNGKVFLVGHLLRYDPRFYGMKDAIDRGDLGEIIEISLCRNSPRSGVWRYFGKSDLSQHVMIHDIDYVNWFLGCKPVKVFAKNRSLLFAEHKMSDAIHAIVTYENGVIVHMEACWALADNSPTIIDDRTKVIGTKGTAYIESCDKGLQLIRELPKAGEQPLEYEAPKAVVYPDTRHWPYVAGVPSGDLNAEVTSFVSAIAGKSKPLSTGLDAYRALTVVKAIDKSIAEGREVDVEGWI